VWAAGFGFCQSLLTLPCKLLGNMVCTLGPVQSARNEFWLKQVKASV